MLSSPYDESPRLPIRTTSSSAHFAESFNRRANSYDLDTTLTMTSVSIFYFEQFIIASTRVGGRPMLRLCRQPILSLSLEKNRDEKIVLE